MMVRMALDGDMKLKLLDSDENRGGLMRRTAPRPRTKRSNRIKG